jgi:hypothetical protein
VLNLLPLAEFAHKQHGGLRVSRLKQPDVRDFVRGGIDGGVQTMALDIDLNHRLIHCDLIWFSLALGLYGGFLHPVVNRRPTALDTNLSGICLVFESDKIAT